jgi:hypothetical protein
MPAATCHLGFRCNNTIQRCAVNFSVTASY